jgi:hypothetical protein
LNEERYKVIGECVLFHSNVRITNNQNVVNKNLKLFTFTHGPGETRFRSTHRS